MHATCAANFAWAIRLQTFRAALEGFLSAIAIDHLTGDEAVLWRTEICRQRRNLVRLGMAAERARHHLGDASASIWIGKRLAVEPSLNQSGPDNVEQDAHSGVIAVARHQRESAILVAE